MSSLFMDYKQFARRTQSYFDKRKGDKVRCWCFAEYKGQTYVAFSGVNDYEDHSTNGFDSSQYEELECNGLLKEIERKGYNLCRLNDKVFSTYGKENIGFVRHLEGDCCKSVTLDKSLEVFSLSKAIETKQLDRLNYSCTERKILSKINVQDSNIIFYCKYLPCAVCVKFLSNCDFYAMYFDSSFFNKNLRFKTPFHRKY